MRHIFLLLLLLPLMAHSEGDVARLQSYVQTRIAAGELMKLEFLTDSWGATDVIQGEERSINDPVPIPYSWASANLDPTASVTSVFGQQFARRLGTPLWTSKGVRSMQMMLGDDADETRAQVDSSLFGIMTKTDQYTFDPDMILVTMGLGGNDYFTGDESYTSLRNQVLACGKKSLETYRSFTDWIVFVAPRPFAYYLFDIAEGTDDQKRAAAIAGYDVLDSLGTFIADSLRGELADLGYNVTHFVTFDARSYGYLKTGGEADTTSLDIWNTLACSDASEYNAAIHLRWSPFSWYKPGDNIHLNDYGEKSYADSIVTYLFGLTPSDAEVTRGSGNTIYCDLDNGNNWTNRTRCTNRNYPLATIQAGVSQAIPGDIVRVIGTGNQAVMLYDSTSAGYVSANGYEIRTSFPDLTIYFESGAYVSGKYATNVYSYGDTLATKGRCFFDTYNCSADGPLDSLSHSSSASIYTIQGIKDLRLTIEGADDNWLSGYNAPIHYTGYSDVKFKNLSITGGDDEMSFLVKNHGGGFMEFYMEDCTVYADSASVASDTGRLILEMYDGSGKFAMQDATGFTGWIKGSTFIGKAGVEVSTIEGPIQGIDVIECAFEDPDVPINWISFGNTDTIAPGAFRPMKFINTSWRTDDSRSTQYAVKNYQALEDSIYFINCDYYAPNATTAYLYDGYVAEGTGAELIGMGSAFINIDIAGNLAPNAGVVTDGYSTRSYATKSLGLSSDTLMFGGVYEFLGYDLTDDFGIVHGKNHASIGTVQYTETPRIMVSSVPRTGIPSYAQVTLHDMARLVSSGILAAADSLDASTWFQVSIPRTDGEKAQWEYLLREWEHMPVTVHRDMKLIVKD